MLPIVWWWHINSLACRSISLAYWKHDPAIWVQNLVQNFVTMHPWYEKPETFAERFQKVPKRLGQFQPPETFWEGFSQCIWNLHVQHCSTQNMKQPETYKIKDGLHDLGVLGKNMVIRDQMVCEDSLVVLRKWSTQMFRERYGNFP